MQDGVAEALFKAYVADGRGVSDPAALAAAAVEGGLDRAEADDLLAGERGAAEVREREPVGRRLGISGVPFFVINDQVALSGAQAPETFRAAFEQSEPAGSGEGCEVGPAAGKGNC